MDTTAEKTQLESELKAIEQYLDHPISQKILKDNKEQEEAAVDLICNIPIDSLGAFFAHFEAVGHLRGLRRARALVQDDVDEIKQRLKEL